MKLKVNDNCFLCSWCSQACPADATYFDGDKIAIDQEKCTECGACIDACQVGAIYDAENPPKPAAPHEPIHLYCDALILGGGAGGLVCAVRVAEMTGKKVIVLEKAKKTGSGAPYAYGIRLFDTKWEKDAGIPTKVDAYIKNAMNSTRWELNPKLVENTFHAIPRWFDWVCEWEHPEEIFSLRPSAINKNELGVDVERHVKGAGMFIIPAFTKRCEELGVNILHEHAAKDFIRNKDGHIDSVVASDPGGETIVHFKTCLVATGSLINSKILGRVIPEYADAYFPRYGHRASVLTGDGVEMAERAGIPIDYDSISIAHGGIACLPADMQSVDFGRPIPSDLQPHRARAEALFVNMNGQRWVNEAFNGEIAWAMLKQPQCASWTVLDHKILTMKPLHGFEGMESMWAHVPFDIDKIRYFAGLLGKLLIIGDTLEKLAEGMGVSVDIFLATVKRYNELCDKGVDEDFYKDKDYLLPIREGPFYAIRTFLFNDGAFGGLSINENMQILGEEGPISGLYAAGDVTSGRYINLRGDKKRYQIINDLTWAVASGFLAGESMAEELKKV